MKSNLATERLRSLSRSLSRPQLRHQLRALFNLILPQSCIDCHKPIIDTESASPYPLCKQCQNNLPRLPDNCCKQCGMPLISELEFCTKCRENRSVVNNCALYIYIGLAQRLLWHYKFSHQKRLAYLFAEQIYQHIKSSQEEPETSEVPETPGRAENKAARRANDVYIVPIPGSPKNVRRRGWDQMRVIANILRRQYAIPTLELFTHRPQKAQKSLGRSDRMHNATATFAPKRNLKPLPSASTAILIDDVYTTGATITACANLARQIGVKDVRSITLCVTL